MEQVLMRFQHHNFLLHYFDDTDRIRVENDLDAKEMWLFFGARSGSRIFVTKTVNPQINFDNENCIFTIRVPKKYVENVRTFIRNFSGTAFEVHYSLILQIF
eukprot:Pompholyxophrys_punicea_v1_NODE_513_length_1790_cov_39.343516.p1 type:complete len:102 gc:universal NODE_513_length_1790_cov_39.343516:1141-836(-)